MQLLFGFFAGTVFGFLLHKGGVTQFNTIIGQLKLQDWTVVKIMLTAIVVGSIGIHLMALFGIVHLHPKPGSVGTTIIGGLIFGIGFAIFGYCPGTVAGAIGQGSLDALIAGIPGILIGSGLFIYLYPILEKRILSKGTFPVLTFHELFKVNQWIVIVPTVLILLVLLFLIEVNGF
jgi:hypothetical protein